MLVLSDERVAELLDMREVIDSVERSMAALSSGKAHMPQRTHIHTDVGDILTMNALVEELGVHATKIVTVYPGNPEKGLPTVNAVIVALDSSTGTPLALMEAGTLTAVRTGAASAVATKYLARRDAGTLAMIGCGFQARYQAYAISVVRSLEKIKVYCRRRWRAEEYAREVGGRTGIDVEVTGSPQEALRGADIIVTATTSRTPVIKREWIGEGAHINAIGSYRPDSRELDTETILDGKVVVDSREAALSEAGDIIIPIREGRYSPERIHAELGEVILGEKPGRTREDEITIFKSVGLAVQDVAAAYVALRRLGAVKPLG